jgi:hypothetical protein
MAFLTSSLGLGCPVARHSVPSKKAFVNDLTKRKRARIPITASFYEETACRTPKGEAGTFLNSIFRNWYLIGMLEFNPS